MRPEFRDAVVRICSDGKPDYCPAFRCALNVYMKKRQKTNEKEKGKENVTIWFESCRHFYLRSQAFLGQRRQFKPERDLWRFCFLGCGGDHREKWQQLQDLMPPGTPAAVWRPTVAAAAAETETETAAAAAAAGSSKL